MGVADRLRERVDAMAAERLDLSRRVAELDARIAEYLALLGDERGPSVKPSDGGCDGARVVPAEFVPLVTAPVLPQSFRTPPTEPPGVTSEKPTQGNVEAPAATLVQEASRRGTKCKSPVRDEAERRIVRFIGTHGPQRFGAIVESLGLTMKVVASVFRRDQDRPDPLFHKPGAKSSRNPWGLKDTGRRTATSIGTPGTT